VTGPARICVPETAVWVEPSAVRDIDAPAVQDLPDLAGWRSAIEGEPHLGLLKRAVTHALLGEPVEVVGERNGWSEIRLPWQPSSLAPEGYPGWIPTAHLIPGVAPSGAETGMPVATVGSAPHVDARSERHGLVHLSLGTVLPRDPGSDRLGRASRDAGPERLGGSEAMLQHPDGSALWLAPGALVPPEAGRGWEPDSGGVADPGPHPGPHPGASGAPRLGERALAVARLFLGMPYFWAGLSGAGVDCSGLVHLSYRVLGVRIPRDADDQAVSIPPVPVAEAAAGDPVFFENEKGVHHVGLALGDGRMLHSPRCDRLVSIDPIGSDDYRGERISAGRVREQGE
jgi:hypothetical protein